MEIRFAGEADIPGLIALLKQVGEVHHQIRPDLFHAGAQKYDEERTIEIGGTCKIVSVPNQGTIIEVQIPTEQEETT